MMTIRHAGALALTAALMLPASAARAAEPSLADIAGCNDEAAARTIGSALPRPEPPLAGKSAPIVEGERQLPNGAHREKTDPSGAIVTDSDDPLAKGMDAQRAADPVYREAYRACMKARASQRR